MRATVPMSPARGLTFDRDVLLWIATGLVLLGAGVFLFGSGLIFVGKQWTDPEQSHGWLIPAVTAFILWCRSGPILAERGPGSWLGPAIVAGALVVFFLAEMAWVKRGPFLTLIPVLIGLGYAALGPRSMRRAILPLVILLFAFPLPGSLQVPLSTTLQLISSKIGAWMLEAVGIGVYLDGNVIDLGIGQLQVAEACSGLRYILPLASFGFLCAWLYRAPLWAKGLVMVSIVPITIVTNSARIALTGVFMDQGWDALAEGTLHLLEGWLIFIVALLCLFALMWLLSWASGRGRRFADLLDFDRLNGPPAAAATQAAPRQVPLPLVACAGLLLAAAVAHPAVTQREQQLPARPGLVTFPLRLEGWSGRPLALDNAEELRGLGADDWFLADYDLGDGLPVNLWVAYYNEQLNDRGIHSPKDCLPGGGWEYASFGAVDGPLAGADGRPLRMNRGVIVKGQDQMVVYYWLELRGRTMTNDTTMKLVNLYDSFVLGRSDGALVRVLTPVLPGEAVEDADARVRDLIRLAHPALVPHVGL